MYVNCLCNEWKPPLAIFKSKKLDKSKSCEKILKKINFNIYKFNSRIKPKNKDRIVIISCFSEFGCETVGCMYCLPRLIKNFPGKYIIAMGWHGREYFYRHLVDEFWEIDENFMWLRDYAKAFHHDSKNLSSLEEDASMYGNVIQSVVVGKYAVSNMCRTCGKFWQEWRKQTEKCPTCSSTVIAKSIFSDIKNNRSVARKIPRPSSEMLKWAKNIVGENCVGIFARNRKTYGRNLNKEFYINLINKLEKLNYKVIWLGEKQNTLPCPVDHVVDFSRMKDSRDLEKTLAIICNLKFTIQFWTASTRLAGMMGVPFILFESPEQIYSSYSGLMPAQEGKRLYLTTFGCKKVVLSHYNSVKENPNKALELVDQAINEMKENNWDDIIGLVENKEFCYLLQKEFYEMLK
jgi:hypothetical protein